jgi:TolA-binding protein
MLSHNASGATLQRLIADEREIHQKLRNLRESRQREIERVERRFDYDIKRYEDSLRRLERDIEQLEREARNKS